MMRKFLSFIVLIFSFSLVFSLEKSQDLEMSSVFTNNMVLPAEKTFTVSGIGQAGLEVELELKSSSASIFNARVEADETGSWGFNIGPLEPGFDALELIVRQGEQTRVLENLLLGDVFILAGQSNVNFPVRSAKGKASILSLAKKSTVRLYSVRPSVSTNAVALPLEQALSANNDAHFWKKSGWMMPDKKTIEDFSAIAWIAAAEISKQSSRPIGIIELAVGGAPVESFLSKDFVEGFLGDDKSWLESSNYPSWCQGRAKLNLSAAFEEDYALADCYHYYMPGAIRPQLVEFSSLPIKGFFWYQGESNAPEAGHPWYTGGYNLQDSKQKYLRLVQDIEDFWGYKVSFFTIQLPAIERNWAKFREMQADIAAITESNLITTIDTGEAFDVHPREKSVLANRLADSVLSNLYNLAKSVSPSLLDVKSENGKMILSFSEKIIASRGRTLRGFEIAGQDNKFLQAKTETQNNQLILSHPQILEPSSIRYAWAGYPEANAIGEKSKMPLAPFRNKKLDQIRIACSGDSITYGYGFKNRKDSYPAILQNLLGDGYLVENFGLSGTCVNTHSLRGDQIRGYHASKEFAQSLAFCPDIVIMNLGINDIMDWHKFGKELFVEDYLSLLGKYREMNPDVRIVLWTPLTPLFEGQTFFHDPGVPEINEKIAQVAKIAKTETIDMRSPFLDLGHLFPDFLHPTPEGAKQIAEIIAEYIRTN